MNPEKKVQNSNTYDEMYASNQESGAYGLPYYKSCYFPLYKHVKRILDKNRDNRILEVGCGSGGFAHYLFDTTNMIYRGFDFSGVAVDYARMRTGRSDVFHIGDATHKKSYLCDYDTIICTEVLEHVEQDLDIMSMWKSGTFCICSVPNFDSPYHVRHFKNENEVISRYGDIIQIDSLKIIKKPVIEDISLSNRLKMIRWNRYRPKRLIELLGLGDFDTVGGWYIFTGYKK
ncbi:class I SAM-dependent methyltransferase [Sedimenticola hydrogenitrophicus]|uniref:class I SAM-dependent methyltransferase n=1 Tax=Sedimenticola hydrogenitrophicus TaxID=2967975 RepID=UPI0023B197C1|nr:class I SAM-dependent methyltransferase [Sedimenticola hydrogenitrophicus]